MKIKSCLLILSVLGTFKTYSQNTDSATTAPKGTEMQSAPKATSIQPAPKNEPAALPKGTVQLTPDKMLYVVGPEALPKGTLMCKLYGDMTKAGPFAIRLKLPANQVIKLHTHPHDEVVTVIEGSVMVGFGDRIQLSKAQTFSAGSFYVNPAKSKHYVAIKEEGATVQINSIGPWSIEFAQPPVKH